jgi:2,3-bisphosphoglycerate-independent phosphoglycerate mutase
MKYIILILDGAGDYPLEELNGKTPLEVAHKPNLDRLAKEGRVGRVITIPPNFPTGSDVAILSLLGYPPTDYYTGRAPLEALGLGIKLKKEEVAFRCNLVTVKDSILEDYSAGHISTEEAKELIEELNKSIGSPSARFYPGLSYRNILVLKGDFDKASTVPPHDIMNHMYEPYLPSGFTSELLCELIFKSRKILENHPINQKRERSGKQKANMIWLWGQGKTPQLPSFKERYKLSCGLVAAVTLVKGIGEALKMRVWHPEGATGDWNTDYSSKLKILKANLPELDCFILHVEAPDEASHIGDLNLKIKTIEDYDKKIISPLIEDILLSWEEPIRLMLIVDHLTPISLRTHVAEATPFLLWGAQIEPDKANNFCERSSQLYGSFYKSGQELISKFFRV